MWRKVSEKNHSNSRKVRLCSTTSGYESTGTENKTTLYYCKDLNNEYYLDMYRGMCQAANERGYLVTVSGVMAFERIKDTMLMEL